MKISAQQVELIGVRLLFPDWPANRSKHGNALRPAGQSERACGGCGGAGGSGGSSIGFGNNGKFSKKSIFLDEGCPAVRVKAALNVTKKRMKIESFFMFSRKKKVTI